MTYQQRLIELLESRIAVKLRIDPTFAPIETFVHHRTAALGLAHPDDYVRLLADRPLESEEWVDLVATVTNGQTTFFRDRGQLAILGDALVELAHKRNRRVTVWSAGCSTGDEPYTISAIARLRGVDVEILGTDVDSRALELAAAARYGAWSLRQFAPADRVGIVRELETNDRDRPWEVLPELRACVRFQHHNLMDEPYPRPTTGQPWDVILCRNVMLYFEAPRVNWVVDRFVEQLAPDGWFLVGPADSLRVQSRALKPLRIGGTTVFRRSWADHATRVPSPLPLDRTQPLLAISAPATRSPSFAHACSLVEQRKLDEASLELKLLVAADPQHVPGLLTLGNVELASHRYAAAADAYAKSHDLVPLLAELHFLQAVLHRKTGQINSAIEASRRALFLDPTFWPAASLHASALLRVDRVQGLRALDHLRSLLAERPHVELISCTTNLTGIVPDRAEVEYLCRHHDR